jgi:hypothetical protein
MADSPDLNEDFADLLRCLVEAKVEFLIVGAHALAAHGVVRATGDLDVFVRPSTANAQRVVEALRRFGAPLATHGVSADDFVREGTVYQLGLPPRRIDVLTRISGMRFEDAWQDSHAAGVAGLEFRVLSRRALLANKRAAGRPKDLEDLRLLALGEDGRPGDD